MVFNYRCGNCVVFDNYYICRYQGSIRYQKYACEIEGKLERLTWLSGVIIYTPATGAGLIILIAEAGHIFHNFHKGGFSLSVKFCRVFYLGIGFCRNLLSAENIHWKYRFVFIVNVTYIIPAA